MIETPGWLYIVNPGAEENRVMIAGEVVKIGHGSIGKYLFSQTTKNS